MGVEHYDFRRVSVTALIPAFGRGEATDIPWSKEMLACLRERGSKLDGGPWTDRAVHNYAAFFESRFKAVNHILEENGATQVLELAAGLSPRGMDFAQRGIAYLEADLADSIEMKREIVTCVLGHVPAKLHLCPTSVLDGAELMRCASVLAGAPVGITTEGLLRYLTFPEKVQLCANVRDILARHGGFWITTDIHLRHWARQRAPIRAERERETLGRDLDPNYFEDVEHAQRFFEENGFAVESRPLLQGIRDRIVSMPLAPEELVAELNDRRVFVMRLQS